ncbi:hypothetical protein T03_10342 [Trichinella britovi]|uniref:Uncharacterized protein n=1 Tax=Trichinella britovi TaxID=45882 RepID=A0A0V1C2V9_TRIBR|nr:hypothetical protein T03_10342 [Trichinella britovi]
MDYIINIELFHTPAVGIHTIVFILGWLNGVTQYWSRNLCGFAYHRRTSTCASFQIHHTSLVVRVAISAFGDDSIHTAIRNHVDKYAITKHYHQLMPLSLATYILVSKNFNSEKTRKLWATP